MPRERRTWSPGDLLSVVGRAHEGRPIFATDEDREFFTDRLRRVFVPGSSPEPSPASSSSAGSPPPADLLAWTLMSNHYHLVIRVQDEEPGRLFLQLNTVVARRERRRRGDHGAVFQDRYWSKPIRGEGSALAVLTYVLGNAAHHGVVRTAEELETYRWTAYGEILGLRTDGLVDARETLALVHPDPATARAALREAMSQRVAGWQAERAGVDVCDEPGCRGESDGCGLVHAARPRRRPGTIGPPVAEAGSRTRAACAGVRRAHDGRLDRAARLRAAGWEPSHLLGPVCARLRVDPRAVAAGSRMHAESRARALIVHVACDGVGATLRETASLVGITEGAATSARRRGRSLLAAAGWTFDDVLAWRGAPPGCDPADARHHGPLDRGEEKR